MPAARDWISRTDYDHATQMIELWSYPERSKDPRAAAQVLEGWKASLIITAGEQAGQPKRVVSDKEASRLERHARRVEQQERQQAQEDAAAKARRKADRPLVRHVYSGGLPTLGKRH